MERLVALPRCNGRISGFVVARDRLARIANDEHSDGIRLERFIVRLVSNEASHGVTKYVLVNYQWLQNEPTLPELFFQTSSLWHMKLFRIPNAMSPSNRYQTFNNKGEPSAFSADNLPFALEGARDEQIPLDEVLPCYVLQPADVGLLRQ